LLPELLLAAGIGGYSRNINPLLRCEALGSGLTALYSACPLLRGIPFGFTNCVLYFASSNINYQLGELVRIAGTFGHETSASADSAMRLKSKLRHYPGTRRAYLLLTG